MVFDVFVGFVGEAADEARGGGEVAGLIGFFDRGGGIADFAQDGDGVHGGDAGHAVKEARDHRGAARDEVGEFVDEFAVDAGLQVFEGEVEVFGRGAELGGEVVAEVLGVEVLGEGGGIDEGAAGFGHFFAVDLEVAMDG